MEEVKNRLVGMVDQMFGPSIAVAMSEGKDVFATQGGPVPTEGDYLDSLDRNEFGMAIEEEFEIPVPDVIVKYWRNLDQGDEYVSATVTQQLTEQKGSLSGKKGFTTV